MTSPDLPKSYFRKPMNRAGGTILFYLLLSFMISLFASVIYIVFLYTMLIMNGVSDSQSFNTLLENIEKDSLLNSLLVLLSPLIALLVALIGSALTGIKLRPLLQPSRLNASTFAVITFIVLGISCAASYLLYPIDALFSLFNLTAQPPDFLQMPIGQPLNMVFYVIGICIGAPLAEEFLFRGVFLHALKPYGNGFAIVISALFFSLIHGNFAQAPGAFLIGIALGVVTLRTGSLLPAIFIHAINNTLSVLEEYLALVTNLSDILIIAVDVFFILLAIVLAPINWPKIKDFWSVMRVRPNHTDMNIITTTRTAADNNMGMNINTSAGFPDGNPLQTDISSSPRTQEVALTHETHLTQETYLENNKDALTRETYLKKEDSPFWHTRWYSFWTSWTMLAALISCILLLLLGGINPL